MKKTITNRSTLTIIIILIILLISIALGNAQAQTYRDRDNDGLIEIYNIEQLDSIRYNLTGTCSGSTCNGYELTRNLDFNNPSSYRSGVVNDSLTMGSGWNPIGTRDPSQPNLTGTEFNTTFEGNSYTIDHLYINRPSTDYIGLFGSAQSSSRIRNIGLRNVSVSGHSQVGGLVGDNNGTISQSHSTGSVSGTYSLVGGLVGYNYNGTISQSHSTGSVSGTESVGGLVGRNYGTISQSYATGSVTGNYYVGGLVGENYVTISQSYATGSVTGNYYVGGLVGGNQLVGVNEGGTISQSHSTGSVSGNDSVGGLVGGNGGTISQSYATGSVTGNQYVGGLVGYHYNGTISHGYWNTNAAQTVNGTARSTHNKVGIDIRGGSAIETHIRGLTLSALQSPTGTVSDSIQELGPGFIYRQGFLPTIHKGARVTINSVNFTQTVPTVTNIGTSSTVADVIEGTDTTRATITVGGIGFTANVIGITNITSPYTITNIQNGIGTGIIGRHDIEISFTTIGTKTYGDVPFVLSASSSATTPIVFFASNTLVSIRRDTVKINGAGTVDITAYGETDSLFGFTNQILTIDKATQSINFAVLPVKTFGQAPFVLSATSSAGLAVLFSASNTLVSINNNMVTIRGAGTVNITAHSRNDTIFGSATQILSIQKALQSIAFGALANKTFGDAPFVLMASSSAGLPVLFSASNTLISIRQDTVTIRGAGTVNITAYNNGNSNYVKADSVSHTFTIDKAHMYIIFGKIKAVRIDSLPLSGIISLNTSSMGFHGPYRFSSSDTTVAKAYFNISKNTGEVQIKKAGITNITAYQEDTMNIISNTVTQPLIVKDARKEQELLFLLPDDIYIYDTVLMDVESKANLPIRYKVLNNTNALGKTIATVDTVGVDKIIVLDTGFLKIIAYCEQTDLYNAALVLKERNIKKVYNINGRVTNSAGNPVQGTIIITQKGGLGQIKRVSLDIQGVFTAPKMRAEATFYIQNLPLDMDTSKYFATYYSNDKEILWKEANAILLKKDTTGLSWVMQDKKTLSIETGNCTIKGKIFLDTIQRLSRIYRSERTPRIKNAGPDKYVIIKKPSKKRRTTVTGDIIATIVTDENGEFIFPNLPLGIYELITDVPGASLPETVSALINLTTQGMLVNIEDVVQLDGTITRFVDSIASPQTITFEPLPTIAVGQNIALTAHASSNLPITYTISDEKIATIKGNTLTALSVGTTTIIAIQLGNVAYLNAYKSQNITIVHSSVENIPLTFTETPNEYIHIFPNPANDYITIQYDKTQKVASVKVYDMTGKSYELGIRNYELGLRVDFKTLSKGEYIIILYGEKGEVLKSEKIIKE